MAKNLDRMAEASKGSGRWWPVWIEKLLTHDVACGEAPCEIARGA
jgi:hypothetical protein